MWYPKELETWTPDALAVRIAEGERLLAEFRYEAGWMREVVHEELTRKRALLAHLQGRTSGVRHQVGV